MPFFSRFFNNDFFLVVRNLRVLHRISPYSIKYLSVLVIHIGRISTSFCGLFVLQTLLGIYVTSVTTEISIQVYKIVHVDTITICGFFSG